MPKGPAGGGDPALGYWMSGMNGDAGSRQDAATRMADLELLRRKQADAGHNMAELKAYREKLVKPLEIRSDFTVDSTGFAEMPRQDRERLIAYISSHRQEGLIRGPDSSTEWAAELQKTDSLIAAMTATVNSLLAQAKTGLDAGDVTAAFESWGKAAQLDMTGTSTVEMEKKVRAARAKHDLGALSESCRARLEKAREMQASFGTPGASEDLLKSCVAIADAVNSDISGLRAGLKTLSGEPLIVTGLEDELVRMETETATMSGRCWAERVRLMQSARDFWAAYEYTDARMKEIAGLSKHVQNALATQLMNGYVGMLSGASSFYVGEANKHFDQDAFGICLVLCQMVEEMIQYARSSGATLPESISDWEKRASDTRKDSEQKLAAVMQRTIVIGDFTPGSVENQSLATMVYDMTVRQLVNARDSKRIAWGVAVEKANSANKSRQGDYLINCEVPEFLVAGQQPVEMERSALKVHRDTREVPNPLWDAERNPKAPQTIFSQEVYVYQKIKLEHTKKAQLKLLATCSRNGQTADLLAIDTQFTDKGGELAGITLYSIEERLDVPFIGPPRTANSKDQLPVDPWPKAISAHTSSDEEVANAVLKYAAAQLTGKLVALVDRYPVDSLAAEAVRSQKLGNRYEAANYWGQCLQYCRKLTGGETVSSLSWAEEKDAMRQRVSELALNRWTGADSEVLGKMPDIWSIAVQSVLDVVTAK